MILSKQQLIDNITTEISDNSTGLISPYDVRHNMLDLIDSVHNLLNDKDLATNNFASLDTKTTKAGKETLKNYFVTDSNNEDNSAFGYSSLRNNFQGVKNTAIGSSALSCNVYGGDNVGVGYKAVAGNTTGYANIGIGNYTIQSNKFGNYNIAIGHAAGYYADRSDSYKLFIASHPVDSGYICSNPLGSGLTPLVHGDLQSLKFGIAVNSLLSDFTLQASGSVGPSEDSKFNLGSANYNYNRIYLSSGITFPSGNIDYSYELSGVAISENVIPLSNNTYNLGTLNNRWSTGYFDEVVANTYTLVETCSYTCKTIHLASSGICEVDSPCGYLTDVELEDAGFLIQSSGSSYRRNYFFQFKPQDALITQLEDDNVYSRSSWNSNISIHVSGGCHVKTDRILSDEGLSLVTQPSGFGIYLRDDSRGKRVTFGRGPATSENGAGDVNFLYGSSNIDVGSVDYISTYGAFQSGVNVSQRFLTGVKVNQLDSENNNKEKLKGFEIKYFDDSNISYDGPLSDRLTISSYNNTSEPVHSLILMKDGDSNGVFGINEFENTSHYMLPSTTLNVRSIRDSVVRVTAESDGDYKSALQLLGHDNCLFSGIEISYLNNSGISDVSMYKDSGKEVFIRMDENSKIGFFAASGQMNDMITIGGSGYNQSVISVNETVGSVSSTEKYGKLYVKQKTVGETQSSTIYFLDSSGNIFDLGLNKYDNNSNLVYYDDNRNTLAGDTNYDREVLTQLGAYDNTAIGYYALRLLSSGDKNVAIGSFAADNISSGDANIAIGYGAMQGSTNNLNNNIIIGNNFLGRQINTSDTLLIGNSTYPLISGNLKSDERHLFLPDGKISLQSNDNVEKLIVSNNTIEVVDEGGDDYPQNQLTFKFTGNESADLLVLKHSGEPLTNTPTYEFANSGIPYAELKGDLRLQNAIRFSDETSLDSASAVTFASGLSVTNSNLLSSLVIEGIAQEDILIGSFNSPTSGIIQTRNNESIYISNRDNFLQINTNDFVIAIKIDQEYRPLWVSSESAACQCCST